MKRLTAFLAVSCIALAACSTAVQRAERAGAPDGAFESGLYNGYLELARAEYDRADYTDSGHFADKAKRVAEGFDMGPQDLMDRVLPQDRVVEMTEARGYLTRLLENEKAMAEKPAELADLQVKFDCWMEEQEENFQAPDIDSCRDRFYDALEGFSPYLVKKIPVKVVEREVVKKVLAEVKSWNIYFALNSADITDSAATRLEHIIQDAGVFKTTKIELYGFADSSGTDVHNAELAAQRVQNVYEFITDQGVDASRVSKESFGEGRLVVDTGDSVREGRNRRVIVLMYDPDAEYADRPSKVMKEPALEGGMDDAKDVAPVKATSPEDAYDDSGEDEE